MLDREPFLRAIFAGPENDLPRLVFADYLQEQGDAAWAELIRVQCELCRLTDTPCPSDQAIIRINELVEQQQDLIPRVYPGFQARDDWRVHRGFRVCSEIQLTTAELLDPERLRQRAVSDHPEWYGTTRLKVTDGRIASPGPLATILTSPVTECVTELDLGGSLREVWHVEPSVWSDPVEVRPAITGPMVVLLGQSRAARRLTELNLTYNDLDNDAGRALARSPHLIRLQRLVFLHGNRILAKTWSLMRERFGADVLE